MLIGDTIEIFLVKDSIMYGRAAFFVFPPIINLFKIFSFVFFSFFNDKFWTIFECRSVYCNLNPGQKLIILEEVVFGVLPTLLKTVEH